MKYMVILKFVFVFVCVIGFGVVFVDVLMLCFGFEV